MEWKDYQIEVIDPGPLFAVLVANVGDAEIDGITLDFSAFLLDSLDIGLNLQLLDPKTKANDPHLGLVPGERLPFSAEEKGAIWAEYTFPGEIAGGNIYARYQWTYTGNSLERHRRGRSCSPRTSSPISRSAWLRTTGKSTRTWTTCSTSARSISTRPPNSGS